MLSPKWKWSKTIAFVHWSESTIIVIRAEKIQVFLGIKVTFLDIAINLKPPRSGGKAFFHLGGLLQTRGGSNIAHTFAMGLN